MLLSKIIAIVLGFQVMLNMTRPLISLYGTELGADTFQIGLLTATYAFFPLVLAIPLGRLADRIGDRIPVVAGTLGITAGIGLPFVWDTLPSLYLSQAIVGVTQILMNISLQNIIGNAATKDNRDHYFSMFSMAVSIGGVLGPVAGGYMAERASFPFAFLVAACVGLMPIAISFFLPATVRGRGTGGAASGSTLALLKMPVLRKALFSSALVLYSRDVFVAYFPLLGQQYGLSASQTGWIITAQGIAMMAIRLFLYRLTRTAGRNEVLLVSILTAGLSFLLVPLTESTVLLALIAAVMGAGLGCGQPLSMTTTYNASPRERTGEVLGLRLATNRLSQMIGPLFFGLLGSWAGLVSVFYVSGIFLVGGAWAARPSRDDEDGREEPKSA